MRWFAVSLILLPSLVFCQGVRNTFYAELGGSAFVYSVNYDRIILLPQEKQAMAARIGITYIPVPREHRTVSGVPVGISLLRRIRKNFAELGITTAVLIDNLDSYKFYRGGVGIDPIKIRDLVIIPGLRLGLRHQPDQPGVFWNAYGQFNTVLITGLTRKRKLAENFSTPWFSLGAGYSF